MRRLLACFFVYTGMKAFRRNAQPASGGCSLEKGLGSSQQAFLRGAGRTQSKNRDLVPGHTACWYTVTDEIKNISSRMVYGCAGSENGCNLPHTNK